ncbi:MAG: helix-turn-helix transcriptional regulator [Burkholderiales bacterium]|nr:helix-turn-helix transcriptional regulator [Burkholderiales bacterium]
MSHGSSAPYGGLERRRQTSAVQRLLSALLDEVDHGMVVLSGDGRVLHLNHAAQHALDQPHPLSRSDGRLSARQPEDGRQLKWALQQAITARKRTLLHLWLDGVDHSVSVMPLPQLAASEDPRAGSGDWVLIKLGRQQLAGGLAVSAYGQARGMSIREQEVLQALCDGLKPAEIASRLGISVTTVRSHVQNLRRKAGAPDVTTLICQVARLPPMMPALKNR